MKRLLLALIVFASGHLGISTPLSGLAAAEVEPIPLTVLYLSRTNSEDRTAAFQEFLTQRFQRCLVENREDYSPEMIDGVDVVIFDWSQRERTTGQPPSPLGPLEQWSKPMVLLGSAGLFMADAWQVIGDAG